MLAVKFDSTHGLKLFFYSAIYNRKCDYLNFWNSTPPQWASARWSLFRLLQWEWRHGCFLLTPCAGRSQSSVRLTAQLAIRCLIANYCTSWHCKFEELSQDGGRADFSKNLRASLINDDLSSEPNFGRIHPRWTVLSKKTERKTAP